MEPGTAAAAAASASAPPAATTPDPEAPVPGGGSRRGWTMFMETPITDAAQQSFGPTGTPTTLPPAEEPSSDNRGWTVFGAPSPVDGGADRSAPIPVAGTQTVPSPSAESSRTVVSTHVPAREPSGPSPTEDLPSPDSPRGKTIIAPGHQAMTGAPGEVTGRGGPVPPMPDTQYFRRGDIQPERPTQRTTEMEIGRPGSRTDESFGDPLAIGQDAPIAHRSSGARTTMLVFGGLVVVGGVVAAVLYLT